MTKRKRTPSASPPRPRAPVQIPTSLQRLSILSRSLAYQSDKLTRDGGKDAENARIIAQAQAAAGDGINSAPTSPSAGIYLRRSGEGQGFRGFAPPKQPSFPDTQTWVKPKPRSVPRPDATGFMPPAQPSFPQGQVWPQPQPRQAVVPPNRLLAPLIIRPPPPQPITETPPPELESPPPPGQPLCLATQPNLVAALMAEKRAANEANRKREAWTRKASEHRRSQAPEDQLLNELNQTLEPSSPPPTCMTSNVSTASPAHPSPRPSGQYVTPSAAITFDPSIPSAGADADDGPRSPPKASAPKAINGFVFHMPAGPRSPIDHDSLFSSPRSSSSAGEEDRDADHDNDLGLVQPQQQSQQRPYQKSPRDQASAGAARKPAPAPPPPTQNQPNTARHRSNSRHAENPALAGHPPLNKRASPATAGYYRFDPRHWQSNVAGSHKQQQRPHQPQLHQHDFQSTYQNAVPGQIGSFARGSPYNA